MTVSTKVSNAFDCHYSNTAQQYLDRKQEIFLVQCSGIHEKSGA